MDVLSYFSIGSSPRPDLCLQSLCFGQSSQGFLVHCCHKDMLERLETEEDIQEQLRVMLLEDSGGWLLEGTLEEVRRRQKLLLEDILE